MPQFRAIGDAARCLRTKKIKYHFLRNCRCIFFYNGLQIEKGSPSFPGTGFCGLALYLGSLMLLKDVVPLYYRCKKFRFKKGGRGHLIPESCAWSIRALLCAVFLRWIGRKSLWWNGFDGAVPSKKWKVLLFAYAQ